MRDAASALPEDVNLDAVLQDCSVQYKTDPALSAHLSSQPTFFFRAHTTYEYWHWLPYFITIFILL